jgi:hypothetical protein
MCLDRHCAVTILARAHQAHRRQLGIEVGVPLVEFDEQAWAVSF